MQTDESIMEEIMSKVEEMIKKSEFEGASRVLEDSLKMEAWREKYETEMLIGRAYCELGVGLDSKNTGKRVDTAEVRRSLENLKEQRILDLPPFWQKLAFEIDSKLEEVDAR